LCARKSGLVLIALMIADAGVKTLSAGVRTSVPLSATGLNSPCTLWRNRYILLNGSSRLMVPKHLHFSARLVIERRMGVQPKHQRLRDGDGESDASLLRSRGLAHRDMLARDQTPKDSWRMRMCLHGMLGCRLPAMTSPMWRV
jgi:hypothetical protein